MGLIAFGLEGTGFFQFTWNTQFFESSVLGRVHLLGSGAQDLYSIFSKLPKLSPTSGKMNELEQAISTGIMATGTLLQSELRSGQSLSNYFGAGYEIAFGAGNVVQKIPELTYIFWDMRLEKNGFSLFKWPVKIIKVCYKEDYLLIRVIDPVINELGECTSTKESLYVEQPIYYDSVPPSILPKSLPPIQSTLMVSFAVIDKDDSTYVTFNFNSSPSGNAPIRIIESEASLKLEMTPEFLLNWHKGFVNA